MSTPQHVRDWHRALGVFSGPELLQYCLLSFIAGVTFRVGLSVAPLYLTLLLLSIAALFGIALGLLYTRVRNRAASEYRSRHRRYPTEERLMVYEMRWYAVFMMLALLGYLMASLLPF